MKATGNAKNAGSRSGHWRRLIDEQARSGQSVQVFCSERGFTNQAFYYWRKRLANQEAPMSFALVAAPSVPNQGSPLELDLGAGQRLRISSGVDAATLRTVLTVLRERA